MAITKGRASNSTTQTVASATWTDILPTGYAGCEEILLSCAALSAAPLRIAISHNANPQDTAHRIGVTAADTPDDWCVIPAGSSITLAGDVTNKIKRVMVAGDGGTATLSWTVTKP